jgi:hypothetical protein
MFLNQRSSDIKYSNRIIRYGADGDRARVGQASSRRRAEAISEIQRLAVDVPEIPRLLACHHALVYSSAPVPALGRIPGSIILIAVHISLFAVIRCYAGIRTDSQKST